MCAHGAFSPTRRALERFDGWDSLRDVALGDERPAVRTARGSVSLVRAIGRWDLTAGVVNGVIGSSIFGMPGTIAALTGSLSPLSYVWAGFGILAIVLCFSEVASRFDEPGGAYLYAREAFGPFVGFQAGWLTFWIRVTSVAANLNVLADYLIPLVPGMAGGSMRVTVIVLAVVLVTILNIVGVKQSARAVDILVVAKLLPLLSVIVFGLFRVSPDVIATQAVATPVWRDAILLLVFAYGGFESALIPASEARDPKRDSPFALLWGLALVAGVYTLIQFVAIGTVPHLASEKAPIAAVIRELVGPAGMALGSLAVLVSVSGWATGAFLHSPRVLYSMAEREEMPAIFGAVHPRFRTPHVAILAFAAASLGFALWGSFAFNATLSAIVRLITYALTAAALPVFRLKRPHEPLAFRLPLAGFVVPIAIAFCLYLLGTRSFAQVWMLGAMMAVGALLFFGRRAAETR